MMARETIFRDVILHSKGDQDSIKLADDWFNELHTYVNPVIDGNRKGHSNPAKVAILDTGIDVRHPSISKALNNSIKAWRGFPESSDPFKDVEGHGTFLACVLMRTAPRTLLYIARIFNDSLKFTDVEVAKAIDWASAQSVDVISISWGMNTDYPVIAEALDRAINKGVIIVASAPNKTYTPMTFPAKYDRVFCIGSAYGDGRLAGSNPSNGKEEKFCTLGQGVRVTWKLESTKSSDENGEEGKYRHDAGTSTATVIAAGIVSLFVDYCRQISDYGRGPDNFAYMRKLFLEMSKYSSGKEYRFLAPWVLFQNQEDPKKHIKRILFEDSGIRITPPDVVSDYPALFGLERQVSDDRFVDRGTNTLERIASRLDKEGKVFVAGLTGMGKTELVKQFVWRMCENEKYKRIIWLTADSEALPSQIQKLAKEFELQTSSETGLEDLWRAMVNRMDVGEKWLVIFDNLEDFQSLRLEKFGGIDMIATLRQSPTAASHGDVELLNRLNEDQAIRLFRTECKHRFSGPSSKFSDQELSTLVQTIGTHPATLCQVLSYMQITGVGVGEFLRAYKKSRVQFWDWRTPEFPSLVSQMSVVFREIKENPDSLRLLCVLSFLHSDSIPAWLLRPNPWLPDDPLKKILLSDWKLTEALRPLLTWSLIVRTKTGFSIQKIVQESMRILMMRTDSGILERLDEKERSIKYWIGRCSELLYPMQGHFVWGTFSDQIEITKQAESCLECCIIYDIDLPINQTLLEAFTAYVILNTGQKYNPKLWIKAVQQYNSIQEPMGVKEGLLCHFISLRSLILKKYDDAFNASQMSMQTASHLMEQSGKWSLQYIYQHGCILFAQGKYDAAAVNFQKVIDFYQRNTFQQVAPLIELGRCLHDKGIESLEEANKLAIEELGSTAPETAVSLMVIGSMYVRVDRDKGLSKCTEALNRFKSAFGENHPREVVLVEHIARVFQDLGEHDLVLEWLQKVEPACEMLYRMNSILCANVLEQMAVSLCCKERYDDAWQRFEKILRLIQIFENSTDTTTSANLEISQRVGSLSETLFSLKRYGEAKSLRQCVISQLRKPPIAFGQSTDRARHQVKLANIYEYEGDINGAHRELTEAVELLQLGLGDADQDVIKAKHEYDKITRILERHREVHNPEEKLHSPIRETQPDVKGLRLRTTGLKKPRVPEDQEDATSSESGSEGNESDSEGNESDSDGTSLNNLHQIPDGTHSGKSRQESSDGFQRALIIGLAICLVLFLLYKL